MRIIIFADITFILSIFIISFFFISFYGKENEFEHRWVFKIGASLLWISIFFLSIHKIFFDKREPKEPMDGFEAWVEKIDLEIEKKLQKKVSIFYRLKSWVTNDLLYCFLEPIEYPLFNYNEDQRYLISNSIVALSIKLANNASQEIIGQEIEHTRNGLIRKGIRIRTELIKDIFDSVSDITLDEYRNEIISFFIELQRRREENPQIQLTVEDILMPYIEEHFMDNTEEIV